MRICRVNKQSNIFCCCFCCRWNCISHPVFGISGINCELLPCEAVNPCDNGAECVEEADPVLFPLGFRCRCRQGFTGPRCEINIDECSSNPCLHGFCYDGKYCSYVSALNSQTQNVSLQSDYHTDTQERHSVWSKGTVGLPLWQC